MSSNLIIYHDRCPDGAAAAWCAQKALIARGETCIFHPAVHGTDPPFKKARASDRTYILDFSYSREKMTKISELSKLLVLDHHASAEARCHGLDFCEFDMNRSGAGMSWDYFHPGEDRPWFINFIEDRDIWKWEFENSREALAFIDTMPKTFETYDRLLSGEPTLEECVSKGEAICQYIDQYNAASIEASVRYVDFQAPNGDIHLGIPLVNASYMGISLVVNEVAKGHPFGIGWFRRNDGKYQFSIRVPEDSDFDATKLAACYKGGGHVKAAGFHLDHELEELPTTSQVVTPEEARAKRIAEWSKK